MSQDGMFIYTAFILKWLLGRAQQPGAAGRGALPTLLLMLAGALAGPWAVSGSWLAWVYWRYGPPEAEA